MAASAPIIELPLFTLLHPQDNARHNPRLNPRDHFHSQIPRPNPDPITHNNDPNSPRSHTHVLAAHPLLSTTSCILARCSKTKGTKDVVLDWLGRRPLQSESDDGNIVILDTIIAPGGTVVKLCEELWEKVGCSIVYVCGARGIGEGSAVSGGGVYGCWETGREV
ncbi:Transcriptional coactivator/pterin dehydratase [Penicillium cf. viridicatum]|uniref:Transcriptional coactivator/pterin dehydratase n=1 Tax=Penicillium cf. viridicatum TaxID=2972119 RepID=A0A9W9LXR0_9EURO|nr:Transcriptional coactivator/pterin dehydratase [Penicillium cf. viridicatum]